MRFENPAWFWLLLLLPLLAWYWRREKPAGLLFSSISLLPPMQESLNARLARRVPPALRILVLVLLTVALARPVMVAGESVSTVEGIDIMLVNDCSSSMTATDLGPQSRLEYAKEVEKDFVSRRPNDRIGLVVFSGRAFTQSPLTVDHDLLYGLIDRIQPGMIEDGTAIGMALGTAVNRLRDAKAKSRVIILLTDGENNAGVIDPITAARIAATFGIKVYTIGVGSPQGYRFTVRDPNSGQLMTGVFGFNEKLLREIARITTGSDANYFNATSAGELKRVYALIDRLESTEMEVKRYEKKTEIFAVFALAALLVLLLELTLRETVFRRLPA